MVYYDPTDIAGTEKTGVADRFVQQNQSKFNLVKIDYTRNELAKNRYLFEKDQLPLAHLFIDGEVKAVAENISSENLDSWLDL